MKKHQKVKHICNWSPKERTQRERKYNKKIPWKYITKTFLNLAKDIKIYSQEVQQTSSSGNKENNIYVSHSIWWKTKMRRPWKQPGENILCPHMATQRKIILSSSQELWRLEDSGTISLKCYHRQNNDSPKHLQVLNRPNDYVKLSGKRQLRVQIEVRVLIISWPWDGRLPGLSSQLAPILPQGSS